MSLSKREYAALWSARTGFTRLLETLPQRPLLMVLNYHRIGDRRETPYDPGIFSATPEELDQQVSSLKKRFNFVTIDEAVGYATGKLRPDRTSVLLTFDDGYRDNYTSAFPVLRSHGVQGVFFLATHFVGTGHLPWWDVIAYIVKHSRHRRFPLEYPRTAEIDLDQDGMDIAIDRVLSLFKRPETTDPERFLSALEHACGASRPRESSERLFLNWPEAQEMQACGMAFGSHTHSHRILSKLSDEEQFQELTHSRQILEKHLNRPADILAYPVGARHAFSSGTLSALLRANYQCAFSFYGGLNLPGQIDRFDVRRYPVDQQSVHRLRLQTTIGAITGSRWF